MVTVSPLQSKKTLADQALQLRRQAAVIAEGSPNAHLFTLLVEQGFDVRLVRTDDLVSESVAQPRFDMVIFDLPRFDERHQSTCMRLRHRDQSLPIMVVSATDSLEDRVRGLDSGADEFVAKPFSSPEMAARLRALLRRSGTSQPSNILRYSDLALDLASRTVYRNNQRIDLSRREFSLLTFLVQHAEQILTRDQILEEVWDKPANYESNVVDVYVNYLRNKLEQGSNGRLVHTVRGKGYMLHRQPGA
ncbi:MAG: Response regulator MprA [Phycisphaerae bacterium]|nr:Response regulator MprA [Phycisphaerae bacterium]